MLTRKLTALTAVPLLLLAGCGDEEPSTTAEPQTTPSASDQSSSPELVARLRDGRLLSVYQGKSHPRGGYQVHVYANDADGNAVEVLADGHPVVPYITTDTVGAPMTVTCAPEGEIAVWTVEMSEPPGIVLAFDLFRTTYALDEDGVATETGSEMVRDHVADPVLRKDRPGMYDPDELFSNCRV